MSHEFYLPNNKGDVCTFVECCLDGTVTTIKTWNETIDNWIPVNLKNPNEEIQKLVKHCENKAREEVLHIEPNDPILPNELF